jgi:hypothetical protein
MRVLLFLLLFRSAFGSTLTLQAHPDGGFTVLDLRRPQPLVITNPISTFDDTVRFFSSTDYGLVGTMGVEWTLELRTSTILSYDDFTSPDNYIESTVLQFVFSIDGETSFTTTHIVDPDALPGIFGKTIWANAPIIPYMNQTHPVEVALVGPSAIAVIARAEDGGDILAGVHYATTVDPPRGTIRYDDSTIVLQTRRIDGYPIALLDSIVYNGVNHTMNYDFAPTVTFPGAPSFHATTVTRHAKSTISNEFRLDSRVERYLSHLPKLVLDALRIRVGSVDLVPIFAGATPLGLYDSLLAPPARYNVSLEGQPTGVPCGDTVTLDDEWYCIGPLKDIHNSAGVFMSSVHLRFSLCDGPLRLLQSGPNLATVLCTSDDGLLVQWFDFGPPPETTSTTTSMTTTTITSTTTTTTIPGSTPGTSTLGTTTLAAPPLYVSTVATFTMTTPIDIITSVPATPLSLLYGTDDTLRLYVILYAGIVIEMNLYGIPRVSYTAGGNIYFTLSLPTSVALLHSTNPAPIDSSSFSLIVNISTTGIGVVDTLHVPTFGGTFGFTTESALPAHGYILFTTATSISRCIVASSLTTVPFEDVDCDTDQVDSPPGHLVNSGPIVLTTGAAHVFNLGIHLVTNTGLAIGGTARYSSHASRNIPPGRRVAFTTTSSYSFFIFSESSWYRYDVPTSCGSSPPTIAAYLLMYPRGSPSCATVSNLVGTPYLNGTFTSLEDTTGADVPLTVGDPYIDNGGTRSVNTSTYHIRGFTTSTFDRYTPHVRLFSRDLYCPSVYSQYPLSPPLALVAMEYNLQPIQDNPLCTKPTPGADPLRLPFEDVVVAPTLMHVAFGAYDTYVPPPPPTCDYTTHHFPCVPDTVCGPDEYEVEAPRITTDRVCAVLTQCTVNHTWASTPATSSTDRVCSRISACGGDEHITVGATLSSDTVCRRINYTCPPGQYTNLSARNDAPHGGTNDAPFCLDCAEGTTTWNPQCEIGPCTPGHTEISCTTINTSYVCDGEDEWLDAPDVVVGWIGRFCKKCRTCTVEKTPCTRTSDRRCDPQRATSFAAGIDVPGEANYGPGCPPGTWANPNGPFGKPICTPFTNCLFIKIEGTPTTARVCANLGREQYAYNILLGTVGTTFVLVCFSVWLNSK